jgi:hypothetical protein
MPAEAVKYIGDKLCVGLVDFSFLPAVPAIPGSAVLNGPVWIGAGGPPIPIANCMIGPGLHPITLQVTGIANFMTVTNEIGITNRAALANITGYTSKLGASAKLAFSGTSGFSAKSATQTTAGPVLNSSKTESPLAIIGKIIGNITATTGINATQAAALATKKTFDIPHPTKEGWRLRHVCVEAPTADVYVKGKLTDSNVIELPDYWTGLVHTETITIALTPIGKYQELSAELSDCGNKVNVCNNLGEAINCSYIIFAERKDEDDNIAEYEGNSRDDYPGDNGPYGY